LPVRRISRGRRSTIRVNPNELIVDSRHCAYVFAGERNSPERLVQLEEIIGEFEELQRNHTFTNVTVTRPANTEIGNANHRRLFLNGEQGVDVTRSAVAYGGAFNRFQDFN
jgi:hypothetical protein